MIIWRKPTRPLKYCKPCIKPFQAGVFPSDYGSNAEDSYNLKNDSFSRDNGCRKMSLCGTVEQRKHIDFTH